VKTYYKPKLYLSAKISTPYQEFNNSIAELLSEHFDVFVPHLYESGESDHTKVKPIVYERDIEAMQGANLAILLAPYGRDCSFEVGWFAANRIPYYVYGNMDQSWRRDLMIKGGAEYIFVSGSKLAYKDDPFHTKIYQVSCLDLSKTVLECYDDHMSGGVLIKGV
jgi:nucleoside 2-deoxyribosyltransferase